MSIADKIHRKRGRPPLTSHEATAPPIAEQITEAENQIAELKAQHGAIALAVVNAEPGAKERFDRLVRDIWAVEEKLSMLRAAHHAAFERDQAAFAKMREEAFGSQLNSVKRHLKNRDEAAVRLSAAIENVGNAWRDLITESRKAEAACPKGAPWPEGSGCDATSLVHAVEAELWRVAGGDRISYSSDPDRQPPAFPGGKPKDAMARSPAVQPELIQTVHSASKYIVDALLGRKTETLARLDKTVRERAQAEQRGEVPHNVTPPARPRGPTAAIPGRGSNVEVWGGAELLSPAGPEK